MVTRIEIEPPIGIPELHDSFYTALEKLIAYVDTKVVESKHENMPIEIQQACAAALVPPTQHAALVLVKFLHTHSRATNDAQEIAAAEEVKQELLRVGKEFKATLDIQKRFATQTMGVKFVPKT